MIKKLLQLCYAIASLALLITCIVFTFANFQVDRIINDIFISIANGASINEFNRIIVGLMSNAKFRVIETNLASVISITSLLLSYLFLQAYLFSKRGIPFNKFFSLKYWTVFVPTLIYKPIIGKKNV